MSLTFAVPALAPGVLPDPRILAGFVAKVGSEVFDASALRAVERFQGEAREGSPAIGG